MPQEILLLLANFFLFAFFRKFNWMSFQQEKKNYFQLEKVEREEKVSIKKVESTTENVLTEKSAV